MMPKRLPFLTTLLPTRLPLLLAAALLFAPTPALSSTLSVVDDAGHSVQGDQPLELARIIADAHTS